MTGCVILASGEGKRFGGNKLTADFLGRPLIESVMEAAEGIFKAPVLVTRSEETAAVSEKHPGILTVLHDEPFKSDSVRLGLRKLLEAEPETDHVIFFQGDQPLVRKSSVERMLGESRKAPEAIIRLSFRGEAGAPVLFPKWAFPELLDLPEGKGGNAVIMSHPEAVRLAEAESAEELMDADTPEELKKLSEAYGGNV